MRVYIVLAKDYSMMGDPELIDDVFISKELADEYVKRNYTFDEIYKNRVRIDDWEINEG